MSKSLQLKKIRQVEVLDRRVEKLILIFVDLIFVDGGQLLILSIGATQEMNIDCWCIGGANRLRGSPGLLGRDWVFINPRDHP